MVLPRSLLCSDQKVCNHDLGSSSEKTTNIWLGSLYPIFPALVAQIFSSLTLLKGQINRRRLNVLLVNIQSIDRGAS